MNKLLTYLPTQSSFIELCGQIISSSGKVLPNIALISCNIFYQKYLVFGFVQKVFDQNELNLKNLGAFMCLREKFLLLYKLLLSRAKGL